MNSRNPVGWFEIYVENLSRAKKFYETVLNLQLQKLPTPTDEESLSMMAFPGDPQNAGCTGALVHTDGIKAGQNSIVIYFSSEDCSIEENRVEKSGGSVFKSKMSIGDYGYVSLCKDTEGNIFGIHSMK